MDDVESPEVPQALSELGHEVPRGVLTDASIAPDVLAQVTATTELQDQEDPAWLLGGRKVTRHHGG